MAKVSPLGCPAQPGPAPLGVPSLAQGRGEEEPCVSPQSIPPPCADPALCLAPCRFHTMSIMIAVDILGCTGSTEERAALLHKTIQLAAELKSTMGNMFSFAAVMGALEMTQVGGHSFSLHGLGSAPCSKCIPLPVSCSSKSHWDARKGKMPRVGSMGPHPLGCKQGGGRVISSTEQTA